MEIGSICLDLVVEAINKYNQAKSLLNAIEILLEPVLRSNNLQFSFREDQFELIWTAKNGELMRFRVEKDNLLDADHILYLIIEADGSILLEEEKI